MTLSGTLAPDVQANLKDAGTQVDGTPKYYLNDYAELTMGVQMDLMAFAASSGYSHTAVLKIGDRSDNFNWPLPGYPRINFHKIAHRSESGLGDAATRIANAHEMHHLIDRIYLRLFKRFLDRLASFQTPTGSLLDRGVRRLHQPECGRLAQLLAHPLDHRRQGGRLSVHGALPRAAGARQPQPAAEHPAGRGRRHQAGRRSRRRLRLAGIAKRPPDPDPGRRLGLFGSGVSLARTI